jgi:hypothetical protein
MPGREMLRISKELDEAICAIFENPDIGYNALGAGSSNSFTAINLHTERTLPTSTDVLTRISLLRRKLEDWVDLKGKEISEFEDITEITRIRSEAITTLMLLRDLDQYFPETETATRHEYDEHRKNL